MQSTHESDKIEKISIKYKTKGYHVALALFETSFSMSEAVLRHDRVSQVLVDLIDPAKHPIKHNSCLRGRTFGLSFNVMPFGFVVTLHLRIVAPSHIQAC